VRGNTAVIKNKAAAFFTKCCRAQYSHAFFRDVFVLIVSNWWVAG
jgi:hypothetical protein